MGRPRKTNRYCITCRLILPADQFKDCRAYCMKHANTFNTTRLCKTCQEMIPVDQFHQSRAYCHKHLKEQLALYKSKHADITKTRRSVLAIRFRIWDELKIFQQPEIKLSCRDIRELLTPEQLDAYSEWAIVPDDPTQPVCKSNAVVVSNKQHMFLVDIWKNSNDLKKYRHFLYEHTFVDYSNKEYK